MSRGSQRMMKIPLNPPFSKGEIRFPPLEKGGRGDLKGYLLMKRTKAILALADGTVFEGSAIGAEVETYGEVVFNTSMTGYQEILTDPSYKRQIVTMTYPHIGNYGINSDDVESSKPQVSGFIVKELSGYTSNWRSQKTLDSYLRENDIEGIQGIDTRALNKRIREKGSQMGIISCKDINPHSLIARIKSMPGLSGVDLVKEVTCNKQYSWTNSGEKPMDYKLTKEHENNPPYSPFFKGGNHIPFVPKREIRYPP